MLTQINLMDFLILLLWVSPFVIQGVPGVFFLIFVLYLIEIPVSKQ